MGKTRKKVIAGYNKSGVMIEVKIRGDDYKVLHKGVYKASDKKAIYYMLSNIEKYLSTTISHVISVREKWF